MTTERKPQTPFFSHAEEKGVTPVEQLDSHLLAYEDVDFLLRDELRPVRLQLEFLKPCSAAPGRRATVRTTPMPGSWRD